MCSQYSIEEDAISVNIGLCPFENEGEYPVMIEISRILFESVQSVVMNANDYFKLRSALEIIVSTCQSQALNTIDCLEQRLKDVLIHYNETQIDLEVGSFIVTFFFKTNIIRFSNSKTYMISSPLLDISFKNWYFIKTNFSSVINFKVSFLEKY